MLDDETVVIALVESVAPRGAVARTLSYHFAFAHAVDSLAVATGQPRDIVESALKGWLSEHDGEMVAVQGIRDDPDGPLPLIRYASLPADLWEGLLAEHRPGTPAA